MVATKSAQCWRGGVVEPMSSPLVQLLTPRPGYRLTPWIIYVNTAVFAAFVLLTQQILWFPPQALALYGGNFAPLTTDGQWWRLVTSVFMHGGLLHLVFNALVLANVGLMLEPLLGKAQLLLIYLVTGVVASFTSVIFSSGAVSVGASGAIFGLYGFFLALLFSNLFRSEVRQAFLRGTIVFIGINLVLGFTMSMIDNAAHIGGLVTGAVLGVIWIPLLRRRVRQHIREPDHNIE